MLWKYYYSIAFPPSSVTVVVSDISLKLSLTPFQIRIMSVIDFLKCYSNVSSSCCFPFLSCSALYVWIWGNFKEVFSYILSPHTLANFFLLERLLPLLILPLSLEVSLILPVIYSFSDACPDSFSTVSSSMVITIFSVCSIIQLIDCICYFNSNTILYSVAQLNILLLHALSSCFQLPSSYPWRYFCLLEITVLAGPLMLWPPAMLFSFLLFI